MRNDNETLKVNSLDEVTLDLFKNAIAQCMTAGVDSVAPLGFSGQETLLFGRHVPKDEQTDKKWSRESLIKFRNYNSNTELLITDFNGNFLFYGKMDDRTGLKGVADFYYNIFLRVKDFILLELPERARVEDFSNSKDTIGWEMLSAFYDKRNR